MILSRGKFFSVCSYESDQIGYVMFYTRTLLYNSDLSMNKKINLFEIPLHLKFTVMAIILTLLALFTLYIHIICLSLF